MQRQVPTPVEEGVVKAAGPEAWLAILALAAAAGVLESDGPRGLWIYQLDKHWSVALNRTPAVQAYSGTWTGYVPPEQALVEFDHWPAGFVTPAGCEASSSFAPAFIAACVAASAEMAKKNTAREEARAIHEVEHQRTKDQFQREEIDTYLRRRQMAGIEGGATKHDVVKRGK